MYYTGFGYCFKDVYAFTYPIVLKYLENKINGKAVADFFRKNNMKSIAICIRGSLNNIGELLLADLLDSDIEVKFFLDNNYSHLFSGGILGVPVISLDDLTDYGLVDAYIVAPIFHFNDIAKDLTAAGIGFDRVISLTDVIYS